LNCLIEFKSTIVTFHSGPFLVSRVGDVGWTKHQVKMSKYKKFKEPKKSYWFIL